MPKKPVRKPLLKDPQFRAVAKPVIQNFIGGITAGLTFGILFLYFDMFHLWTIMSNSEHLFLVMLMFFAGLCSTFGGIGLAVGIMMLGSWDDKEL